MPSAEPCRRSNFGRNNLQENTLAMRHLTKIAGVLFAYFCITSAHFLVFIFTPLFYCFGGEGWREKRDHGLKDVVKVGAKITPPLTWMCLTISIMVFWATILERYFFFEDHERVANWTLLLSGVTLLPFVLWWLRNRGSIMDVKTNLRLGEKNRILYSSLSLVIFFLQLLMPFVALWF